MYELVETPGGAGKLYRKNSDGSLWIRNKKGDLIRTSMQEYTVNVLKRLIASAETLGISKIKLPTVSENMTKQEVVQAFELIELLAEEEEEE
jgi:hypothetical protein